MGGYWVGGSCLSCTNPDALIREIGEAFDHIPKPPRITLQVARGIDDYVPDDELDELRDPNEGSRWQDLPSTVVEEYWDVHPFLCPIGFRYYLPVFMIWTIKNHRQSALSIPQWTISSLDCPDDEKLALLDQRQRAAISNFLKYAIEHLDPFDAECADEVYEGLWKQFDT